jgi:phytoene synthase
MTASGGFGPDYAACRALHRRYGTTYYWAAHVLPGRQRRHVHALYAYCRLVDEIVDDLGDAPVDRRRAVLSGFRDRTFRALDGEAAEEPVVRAFARTVTELGIDREAVTRFLRSMEMDLGVDRYATWDDLLVYMDGSAAVIGEMMLPVLEPLDLAGAWRPARDLGLAFQLTNFLRDVGEDLDRGRVYLPRADLRRYEADPAAERQRVRAGAPVSDAWASLMRFELGRARNLYVSADIGIGMLPERSARAVRAARLLYSRILDLIEERGYDVFTARLSLPAWQRLVVAGQAKYGSG